MSNIAKVLLIFLTMVGMAAPLFASGLRVDNLGISGLVPDEERDLDFNPARISSVKGDTLFTNISFELRRENIVDDTPSDQNSTFQFYDLSTEFAHGTPEGGWAFRFSPAYARNEFTGHS